ncbi:MAG: class I SAM-dependent rRNA methyltransferase [Thermotogota bacterium]|nr:class I SAM-dependent rRNA methyltransferase [Thermotogota bacterium]
MNREKDRVVLKRNIRKRIAHGHPWIYSNEISKEPDAFDGSIVDVFNCSNHFVGKGFYCKDSKIRIRLITRKFEKIDEDFLSKRIKSAWLTRKKYLVEEKQSAMRIVFADADYLPGLIVDRYGDYLVVQFNNEGIKQLKDKIVEILETLFKPKGIFQNSIFNTYGDNNLKRGWITGNEVELIPFKIDNMVCFADTHGPGTGFYLDQRDNAENLSLYAKHKHVLDLFSFTGNFSLRLLKKGALHATLVDNSKRALEVAEEMFKYNNLIDKATFINENVFQYINNEKIKAGLVVFDPPPLGKSSKNMKTTLNSYKELNVRTINDIPNDGILGITCRSYNVTWTSWYEIINKSFIDTNRVGRLLYMGGQSVDFPSLSCIYETSYLKFNIYMIERN